MLKTYHFCQLLLDVFSKADFAFHPNGNAIQNRTLKQVFKDQIFKCLLIRDTAWRGLPCERTQCGGRGAAGWWAGLMSNYCTETQQRDSLHTSMECGIWLIDAGWLANTGPDILSRQMKTGWKTLCAKALKYKNQRGQRAAGKKKAIWQIAHIYLMNFLIMADAF